MRLFAPLILGVLIAAGCAAGEPTVELRDRTWTVEIADDPGERQLGLMFRDELAPDRGMLFIFPDEAPRAFWMRNTRIPLDILYFDRDRRLVGMSLDTPPCRSERCPGYPSGAPAMYVLEVNAGQASELGVTTGDELTIRRR